MDENIEKYIFEKKYIKDVRQMFFFLTDYVFYVCSYKVDFFCIFIKIIEKIT